MFSPRPTTIVSTGLGLALLALTSCSVPQSFICQDDSQCGEGQCVLGGCAFPDDACPSGLRYGELSNDAGECAELDPIAEGGSESGTSGGESEESGSETGATETGATETGATETGSETGEPEPEPAEVLAHYTLDSGEVVGLVVLDSSGNELHALAQSVQPQPPGVSGQSLEFQPLSRIEFPLEVLADREEFTFECYIQLDTMDTPLLSGIFYYGNEVSAAEPPVFGLHFGLLDPPVGTARVYWSDGEVVQLPGTTSFLDSPGWHHLAFTTNAEGVRLYVDHKLEVEDPLLPAWLDPGLTQLSVGSLPTLDSGFEGLMDELRFSDRALEPDEMLPLP